MHKKFIDKLICPHCKKSLKVKNIFFSKKDHIAFGLLGCKYHTYPILDGILFISQDRKQYLAFVFYFLLLSKISPLRFLSFAQLISLASFLKLTNKDWASYLINRLKRKDFHPTAITSSLVKKDSTILDAGCGAGHLLYLLKPLTAEENLCGIDFSLPSLYLAKKYSCKGGNFIYFNLNQPLPFKNKAFQYIISSDTFHCISNKKLLGQEFQRVITNRGLIILNHLANKSFVHAFKHRPRYPEFLQDYLSFFPNLSSSLFSEKHSAKGRLIYIKNKDISKQIKKLKSFTLVFSNKKAKKLRQDIQINLNSLPKEYSCDS